jgi:hypothetical protein
MMMNESIYRLGEYRITEYENGLLRWETHFNFGVQRSGKCYIFGDILIIGHWSNEGSGYLQLEFSELLQKLPIWNKTLLAGNSMASHTWRKKVVETSHPSIRGRVNAWTGLVLVFSREEITFLSRE